MAERLDEIASRLGSQTGRQKLKHQPGSGFYRDLADALKQAKTPEEEEAIWQRFTNERDGTKPNRRQRRGATLDPVKFRRLDRNQRCRIIYLAEQLDAHSHEPGKHGGCLKRTGLHALRILLFHFLNMQNGRCDPSIDAIAKACGMARSTVVAALQRLEDAGIIERIQRARWVRINGRKRCVQWSNAYRLNVPYGYRKSEGDYANSAKSTETGKRSETTGADKKSQPPMPENVAAALARLGNAMAKRAEMENERMKHA